jgi:hypothetical protein
MFGGLMQLVAYGAQDIYLDFSININIDLNNYFNIINNKLLCEDIKNIILNHYLDEILKICISKFSDIKINFKTSSNNKLFEFIKNFKNNYEFNCENGDELEHFKELIIENIKTKLYKSIILEDEDIDVENLKIEFNFAID